jgi:LPS-assembly protein
VDEAAEAAEGDPAIAVDERIQITSEGAEVSRTGDAVLKGKVRIRQGERTLNAEDATFNAEDQSFSVSGNVTYRDPELRIKGKSANVAAEGGASFEGAEFELPSRPARGSAGRIEVDREGTLGLNDVVYTTCPTGNEDWVIRASDIDINPKAGLGSGRNVRLDFKGIPILYTPYISFPVGDQRKSGFLFPTLANSSRSGVVVAAPWYWNIAPNQDATITSTWYTSRGFDLLTDYRFLTKRSTGSVIAEYLPDDMEYGSSRSLVQVFDKTDLSRRLRFTVAAANASDRDWFEDFGEGSEGTSVVYLQRQAAISYFDRYWTMSGRVENFQSIQPIDEDARPYTLLPQISIRGALPEPFLGFDAGIDSEYTYFERNESVTGSRLDIHPGISLPLRSAGAYLLPAVSWRYTAYALNNTATGADDSPSRSAPIGSVDAGLTFERPSGSRQQRLQTFEPRFLYLYVPYRDQSTLPVFDTNEPDLNLVQLFRNNRYVGADRLGDANQLSVGFTTRLLDRDTGKQFVSASAGQAYYFDAPRVVLPDEPVVGNNSSNMVAQLEVSAFKNWNVRMGVQWDPHETRSEKGDAQLQYAPAHNMVANLGYRFRRDSLEQWDASVAWPVTDTWSTYGGVTYSVKDSKTINQFAGLEYRSCCWKARIVGRKYVSSRTGDSDSDIQLQLELNGLASLVPGVDAFLERSIRGYSVLPPAMP